MRKAGIKIMNITPKMVAATAKKPAALKYRKPRNTPAVKDCIHREQGGIYCQSCANSFLAHARKVFAKALATPDINPIVMFKAKEQLKNALEEHSLTPDGINGLERTIASLTALHDFEGAEKSRALLASSHHKIAERNKRVREIKQKNQHLKATAAMAQRIPPPRDLNGNRTTQGFRMDMSAHAKERQATRKLSTAEILDAYRNVDTITFRKNGVWRIEGVNGVGIVGVFTATSGDKVFEVLTVYRIEDFVGEDDLPNV